MALMTAAAGRSAGRQSDGPAIVAEGLVKSFGDVRALDGVDLEVRHGTVFGLLGPNGAGKTTAVRVLTTLLQPDAGTARVAGLDVVREAAQLRERIGLAGQYAAVDENLTGSENLVLVGRLYGEKRPAAKARAAELLERFDLVDAASRPAKTYSGGMRRRLDLAAALVARPPIIFLDEPTTGLDPRSRLSLWETIERLVGAERCERLYGALAVDLVGQPDLQPLAADAVLERVRRALRDHLAVVDDRELVGEPVGLVEVLGGEEDGRALGDEPLDRLPEAEPAARVEARGRLVQEDDRRASTSRTSACAARRSTTCSSS